MTRKQRGQKDWTKRSVEEVKIKGKVAGKGKIDVQNSLNKRVVTHKRKKETRL